VTQNNEYARTIKWGDKKAHQCIRIFPNDDSALRLIGALLAEANEQWVTIRYLDMDEFNEWLMENEQAKTNVIEINQMAN
jgi:putative transposase